MRKIPDQFVNDVLSRVNIVDVLRQHVHIQKSGAQFKALCPFHQEKTPSFVINQSKQFYYCFGCGAKGDAIQFLKEHDGLSFSDAVEKLAAMAGLEVPREELTGREKEQIDIQKRSYAVLEQAASFYESELKKSKEAINYLKERGLSGIIAKKFRVGFAPAARDSVLNFVKKRAGANNQDLLASGLCLHDEKHGTRTRFWGRITFPIRNRRGIVVGFGARSLPGGSEPKYLNSPESVVFSKKNELYGLYEARQDNKSLDSLLIVEGYMDVIALHQNGISNAVATLGTSLTKEHIEILFTNTDTLVFCFDGDNAGRLAAKRAMELCLPLMRDDRRVKFLFLPEGLDPDSYVRAEGKESMVESANRAITISDYIFAYASRDLNLDLVDDRLTVVNRLKPLLDALPSVGMLKEMLYSRLAQLVGIDTNALLDNKIDSKDLAQQSEKFKKPTKKLPITSPAFRALAIILREPALLEKIDISPYKTVGMPGVKLLCEVANILNKDKNLSFEEIRTNLPNQLTSSFVENELKGLIGLLSCKELEQELNGALAQIRNFGREQIMDNLIKQAQAGSLKESERDKLMELLSEKSNNSG